MVLSVGIFVVWSSDPSIDEPVGNLIITIVLLAIIWWFIILIIKWGHPLVL